MSDAIIERMFYFCKDKAGDILKKNKFLLLPCGFFTLLALGAYNAAVRDYPVGISNWREDFILGIICTAIAGVFLFLFYHPKEREEPRGVKRTVVLRKEREMMPKPETESLRKEEAVPDFEEFSLELSTERKFQEEECPTPKGAMLSYLDAEALRFWSKKRTDFDVPAYYSETSFGRNAGPALQRLLSGGYLALGDWEQRISLQTVPELKAILADKELKVSGKKAELVNRIIENIDSDDLESLFPVNVYSITEKGEKALEPYSIIEDNNAHSLGISYYRLLQEKEKNPGKDNDDILEEILLEDIQRCYREQNQSDYQTKITTAARFFHEIGKDRLSFECYSLSFFMWTRDIARFEIERPDTQSYYISKNLEQAGQFCGYDLDRLIQSFQSTLLEKNPFGLGTPDNIKYSLQIFKKSLGIK